MQPGGSLEAWTIGRETKALSLVMTHQLVLLNTHLLSDIIVQRQHRTLGSPWSLFSNTRFIWFFHRVLKLFISKIVQIFKHTFFSFDFEFFFVHAGLPAKVKTRTESPETLCILSDDSFNSTLSTPAVALLTNSEYANGKYSWQGKANPANGGATSSDNTLPSRRPDGDPIDTPIHRNNFAMLPSSSSTWAYSPYQSLPPPPHHIMRKSAPRSDVGTQCLATAVLMTHQLSCRSCLALHTNL